MNRKLSVDVGTRVAYERGMPSYDIGGMLRAAREHRRLTLDDVAAEAGTSKQHLSQVERSVAVPSVEMLSRMLRAVGLELVVRKRRKAAG